MRYEFKSEAKVIVSDKFAYDCYATAALPLILGREVYRYVYEIV